jgi:hypothetical protein
LPADNSVARVRTKSNATLGWACDGVLVRFALTLTRRRGHAESRPEPMQSTGDANS